jgi:hypothetical protein
MPKRKSISKLKKEAWEQFSKYIRLRDCLVTMGSKEQGRCFTCGKVYPFKSLQAGHFIDGRNASVLFDEDLVHAQCVGCNIYKSGNKDEYTPKMIELYGLEKVQEFWQKKNQVHQWRQEELEQIKNEYKELYKDTMENN